MPLRLSELVKQYPYLDASRAPADDQPGLPVPRFSTRRRDAVYVRGDTPLPAPTAPAPAKEHPLRLISDALRTAATADAFASEEARALWEEIQAKASEGAEDTDPALSRILDDESLRLLCVGEDLALDLADRSSRWQLSFSKVLADVLRRAHGGRGQGTVLY